MQLSRFGEFTLLVASMLSIMVGAALAPGLQSIARALGVEDYAPLLITLPALGAIVFAPLFGRLIDRFGARNILLFSLWGYFFLGVAGMWMHGMVWVALDRILLGAFAVGLMASNTAVISHWYEGRHRLMMIAKQGMAIELGGVVFLFIGGLLSELNWQAPFLLYTMGLLCVISTWLTVPISAPLKDIADIDVDKTSKASMQPVVVAALLAMALFFSMVITLPSFLGALHYSEAQIGYLLSFISLVAVISAMLMPKLVGRTSEKFCLIIAFFSYAMAHILFALATDTGLLIMALICAGVGFGFSIPLLNHTTVERSSEHNRGRNLAVFGMAVFSGQFVTSILEFIPVSHIGVFSICAFLSLVCMIGVTRSNAFLKHE